MRTHNVCSIHSIYTIHADYMWFWQRLRWLKPTLQGYAVHKHDHCCETHIKDMACCGDMLYLTCHGDQVTQQRRWWLLRLVAESSSQGLHTWLPVSLSATNAYSTCTACLMTFDAGASQKRNVCICIYIGAADTSLSTANLKPKRIKAPM